MYGDDPIESEGVTGSAYLLAGILGYGVAATAFAGLAIILVLRRESGVLKRLRANAAARLRPTCGAVLVSTLIVFAIEVVALLVLANAHVRRAVPGRAGSRSRLAVLLGVLAFAALGVALTTVHPLGRGRFGRGQRRLPADGLPGRIASGRRRRTRPCWRRSPTSCR